jgi:hypothetical protein
LQGVFDLLPGHESLEFGTDDPLSINHKYPRLRLEPPFFHGRKHFLLGEVLPKFLMRKGHSCSIGWQQSPHNVDHRPAHAAGAESRRSKNDDLRLALLYGVGDANLMQPGIRLGTGIDLA